jgi:hypothetical protein
LIKQTIAAGTAPVMRVVVSKICSFHAWPS